MDVRALKEPSAAPRSQSLDLVFNLKFRFMQKKVQNNNKKKEVLFVLASCKEILSDFTFAANVSVIVPRPDTLALSQEDIKHMENIGQRKEGSRRMKSIRREFKENTSPVSISS